MHAQAIVLEMFADQAVHQHRDGVRTLLLSRCGHARRERTADSTPSKEATCLLRPPLVRRCNRRARPRMLFIPEVLTAMDKHGWSSNDNDRAGQDGIEPACARSGHRKPRSGGPTVARTPGEEWISGWINQSVEKLTAPIRGAEGGRRRWSWK